MLNKAYLKYVIERAGLTTEDVCQKIGMSRASFSYKLNSKREFTQSEIYKIKYLLKLEDEEVIKIFFAM